MNDLLASVMDKNRADYLELRYHARDITGIKVVSGELEQSNTTNYTGVGIRALVGGAWGFSSTSKLTKPELMTATGDAIKAAKAAAPHKSAKVGGLADAKMARGRFRVKADGPLPDVSFDEKMKLVTDTERSIRRHSKKIKSAISFYREIIDRKVIVNTDGADADTIEPRAEFYAVAVAGQNGELVTATETDGVVGGWRDLFRRKAAECMAEDAAKTAVSLLKAPYLKGGKATVILDPAMVGLIAHEAFGHTVEADFVLSGSAAKGKIGKKVASELVTLVDSGNPKLGGAPAGTILVDDEGVLARDSVIVKNGIMKSYLCDREAAEIFGMEPTGNARAFEYSDEPLIRMRNTYIAAGDWRVDEMLEGVRDGYLLNGGIGGQADANAEFMFIANEVYEVKNGEVGRLFRGATISGNAFDVLGSVDAVGKDFCFDMGSGYCGKSQPAKVDGGGGHIRCKANVSARGG
jgi:TldD protein